VLKFDWTVMNILRRVCTFSVHSQHVCFCLARWHPLLLFLTGREGRTSNFCSLTGIGNMHRQAGRFVVLHPMVTASEVLSTDKFSSFCLATLNCFAAPIFAVNQHLLAYSLDCYH
jgi:hypothetical protein